MTVLLVSRGSMAGGRLVGQCLNRNLGCLCLTREELIARVNSHGEIATRMTSSLDRASKDYEAFSEIRRPYRILMRLALLEYARGGNLVYLGNSGHLLLPPVPHFIRVRLNAPLDLRVRATVDALGLAHEEAVHYIAKVDEERSRWARFMYAADIRDPSLYDLCINLARTSVDGACTLLMEAVRLPEFQPTAVSLAQVEDLFLATEVEAEIAACAATCQFEVGATAVSGKVVLQGPYLEARHLETVINVAKSVPRVSSVEYQPGYAPDMDCAAESGTRAGTRASAS
jgi:hypothetical protein